MKTKTLSQLEDEHIGKKGSPDRDRYESEVADMLIAQQTRDECFKFDPLQEDLS